jgi:kynurenine formamidase
MKPNLLAFLPRLLVTLLGWAGSAMAAEPPDQPSPLEDRSLDGQSTFIDHSLWISEEFPCNWPTYPFPKFQKVPQQGIGRTSLYHIDMLIIDGNTGTQLDTPPHSVLRPELNQPKSGPLGLAYTDRIEPWQFGGEACVVDVRGKLAKAPPGVSPLVGLSALEAFEKEHRAFRRGDVVLFRSDYTDLYYRPFPEGSRFINDVIDRKVEGYPDPNPEAMEWLGQRGILAAGTDSPSMGPVPDLAEATHYAGLRHGMIWTEGATGLGRIPTTGAFYCFLGPRHEGGPYGEGRAFSITGGDLPQRLIKSCREKRARDLSPVLTPKFPMTSPGVATGSHRQSYLKVDFLYSPQLDLWHHAHWMDSMAGTHLVPPAYALPLPQQKVEETALQLAWRQAYEQRWGARGTSNRTCEQVPISWTCGPLQVIDVRAIRGSTERTKWPASPSIGPSWIESHEATHGRLKAGQIVLFQTGYIDRYLAMPRDSQGRFGQGLWSDGLLGKEEGWPAVAPETIDLLHQRGIRCVATDAPDLGGVDPQSAVATYWLLGSRDMVGIEFLCNTDSLPKDSFFLFAPLKIIGCHGGPGRAIALY